MTAPNGRPEEPARHDTVAAVVRQWQTVHPGLDTGPMEIIGRVNRCAALLQQAEDAPCAGRDSAVPSSTCSARCAAPATS